jgi:SAM-dependent methyltransferase
MDFRKLYLQELFSNTLESTFKPQTLWKAIKQPWKIPGALLQIYKDARNIMSDVKLRALSTEYLLNTVSSSVSALAMLSSLQNNALDIKNIKDVFGESGTNPADSEALSSLFKSHGSDKSTKHNYYLAYSSILAHKKDLPMYILEIGLGTNNIDVMANMGTYGQPGASLRAFRDMYQKATVFGADIDKRILFSEERITTYFVDQTDMATLNELKKHFAKIKFDLIIDDGLHNSHANLNTTNFALDLLKPDGVFVIEDICPSDVQYYQIVAAILKDKYSVDFIETKFDCMCMVKRIGSRN